MNEAEPILKEPLQVIGASSNHISLRTSHRLKYSAHPRGPLLRVGGLSQDKRRQNGAPGC